MTLQLLAQSKKKNRTVVALFAIFLAILFTLLSQRPAHAATTVIRVCSQQGTYYYNILGTNAQSLRAKLDNPANFGPTGLYGDFDFEYVDVGDNFTEQTILNNGCNIWFSGYEADYSYTPTELTELQNWVANNNGQVMAGCDGSYNDPVCDLLNFTVTTDTDTYGFIVEKIVNPLTCDGLLDPGDQLNMAGGVGGYFSGAGVTEENTLAVHETNGTADNSKPIIVYTGNFFFTADINMIQNGGTELTISDGPSLTTNNDIMAMNAFASLADASIGNEVCTSVVVDTDDDGIPDDEDLDDDNDGQSDEDEIACGSDPLDANSVSSDEDEDNIPDCVDPDFGDDGCVVLALEGSPYTGEATIVQAKNGRFNALKWKHEQGLPIDTCFRIHGTDGNDRIWGAYENDTIFGYDGNDKLYGKDGNDVLIGGEGNDYLNGNDGFHDELFGDDGNDRLVDMDGVAAAHGGAGNDRINIHFWAIWESPTGNPELDGLISGGYGNDKVTLDLNNYAQEYTVNISGDEHDDPPSAEEGNSDKLTISGHVHPDSAIIKFEKVRLK